MYAEGSLNNSQNNTTEPNSMPIQYSPWHTRFLHDLTERNSFLSMSIIPLPTN
jgi:hypothetical protein